MTTPTPPIETGLNADFLAGVKQSLTELESDNLFPPITPAETLFAEPEKPPIGSNHAANFADKWAAINGLPLSAADQVHADMLLNGATVEDYTIQRISQIKPASNIRDIINNNELTQEQRYRAITHEINTTTADDLTSFDSLVFEYFRLKQDGIYYKDLPLAVVEQQRDTLSLQEQNALSVINSQTQLAKWRRIVEDTAATFGWKDWKDMAGEVALQEFALIYNILSRAGLTQYLATNADIPLNFWQSLLPGSAREAIRKELTAAVDTGEVENMLTSMTEDLLKLRDDPVVGPLITDINAVEFLMFTLTDEALTGQPIDKMDKFFGNFEFFVEAIFSVAVITAIAKRSSKIGKLMLAGQASDEPISILDAYRQTDKSKLTQVTSTVRNSKEHRQILEKLLDEATANKYQINADAAGLALLPKPAIMTDDVVAVLGDPANVAPIERMNAAAEKVIGKAGRMTRREMLSTDEQVNAILKELNLLDDADQIRHYGSSSTIDVTDEGYKISAIYGQFSNSGWTSFDDLLLELRLLDPEFRRFEIVMKADDGTFAPIILTTKQLEKIKETAESMGGSWKVNKHTRFGDLVRMGLPETEIGKILQGEEYFLRRIEERGWHPTDKAAFNTKTLSSGIIKDHFLWFLPPHAKFKPEFYNPFLTSWLDEQAVVATLKEITIPFRKLSAKDQRYVQGILEWSEEYAKKHGRTPTFSNIRKQFPSMSDKQLIGLASYRKATETNWVLTNYALYKEMYGAGYQTMRPLNSSELASYHGAVLERGAKGLSGEFVHVVDPLTLKTRVYTKAEIDALYAKGDSVMEIDIPIKTVDEGVIGTRILIDQTEYRISKLSDEVLEDHPGYYPRFYSDPYYLIKVHNVLRNGVKTEVETAIRTVVSHGEGVVYRNRMLKAYRNRYKDTPANIPKIRIMPAKNLRQTESAIFQKQVFQTEGRLFFDKRNFDRLPNTNRSRAEIEDAGIALDRAINLVSRQLAGQDPLRMAKSGWKKLYSTLPGVEELGLNSKPMYVVEKELKALRAKHGPSDPELKKQYDAALHYIRYFRLMEGTAGDLLPAIREFLMTTFQTLESYWKGNPKVWRGLQNWAQTTDPFRAVRSISHTLFIKMRPLRQLPMQTAQVMFLSGLDPAYVASTRIFYDMAALAIGKRQILDGVDMGFGLKTLAKTMGLSPKQYRQLVIQIDDSGLWQAIDVHDFSGEVVNMNRRAINLPSAGSNPLSGLVYQGRKISQATLDVLGQGFVKGEMNNITGTYMIALRRYMKENNIKDLTKIDTKGWDTIRVDTSNLALGMVKPNNMAYQRGFFSMALQFKSFQHKAFIALLGQNPAIKSKEAAFRLWVSGTLLYGAEFWGMHKFVTTVLENSGLEWMNETKLNVPGSDTSYTFADWIRSGLLFNMINAVGQEINPDSHHVDLSPLVPSFGGDRWTEDFVTNIFQDPIGLAFGPAGTLVDKFSHGFKTATRLAIGLDDKDPHERLTIWLKQFATSGAVPLFSDAHRGFLAYKLRRMYTSTGKLLPFEPDVMSTLARIAGFGTVAEWKYYNVYSDALFNEKETYNQAVKEMANFIAGPLSQYYNHEINEEYIDEVLGFAIDMYKDELGEQRVVEFLEDVVNTAVQGYPKTALEQMTGPLLEHPLSPEVLVEAKRTLESIPSISAEDVLKTMQILEEISKAGSEANEINLQFIENQNRDRMRNQ